MRTHTLALLLIALSLARPAIAQDTSAPTAVADAQATLPFGGVLMLSGARSVDVGGRVANYTWTRLEGAGGDFPLNQPQTTELPAFIISQSAGNPLRPGRHRFALQVADDSGLESQPVVIQIIVMDNVPPVAVIGALANVYAGTALTLHGEHSVDVGGSVARYDFTRLKGDGGAAMPHNKVFSTTNGLFTVPQPSTSQLLAPGQHLFRLVVVDDAGNQSAPRDLVVNVLSAADTSAPTAVLDAPNSVTVGTPLTLSAARSVDVGGQIVQYVWTHLEGGGSNMPLNQPFVTDASSITVPQPAGAALAVGRHRFRLVVKDSSGNESQPAERQLFVVDNIAPTAVLDAPREVMQGQAFQLSAARSADGGGRVVSYRWTRIAGSREGPMGINQTLVTDAPAVTVSQTASDAYALGQQVFRLVVVDDSGNLSQPADIAVNVVAKR